MPATHLYVYIVLDRSGSMMDCRDETISTLNEYLTSLRSDKKIAARVSLSTFDSEGIDLIRNEAPVLSCEPLRGDEFEPRALTPLFDAVGRAVSKIEQAEKQTDERVALVILTDGLENASVEFNAQSLKKLLEDKQVKDDWLVLYLGADHDAWSQGARMGLSAAHTVQFDKRHMRAAGLALYAASGRYSEAPIKQARKAAAFTPDERAASLGKNVGGKRKSDNG